MGADPVAMYVGLLWFDNNPIPDFTPKLARADNYYFKKFGQPPDICLINPETAEQHGIPREGKIITVNGHDITVRIYNPVLPDHFWIGREDK